MQINLIHNPFATENKNPASASVGNTSVATDISLKPQSVPEKNYEIPKSTPKDFFFYLSYLTIVSTALISTLSILDRIIRKKFPMSGTGNASSNLFNYYDSYFKGFPTSAVASLISALIFLLPFLFMRLKKEKKNPLYAKSFVPYLEKSFVIYSGISALFVLCSGYLYSMIEDDLSTQKTLSVIVFFIALLFFTAYHFYLLKKSSTSSQKISFVVIALSYILSITVVVGTFFYFDKPISQTKLSADATLSGNIQAVASRIKSFAEAKKVMPTTLKDSEDYYATSYGASYSTYNKKIDTTKIKYAMPTALTSDASTGYLSGSFTLCATFFSDTETEDNNSLSLPYSEYDEYGADSAYVNYYKHKKGESCFTEKVKVYDSASYSTGMGGASSMFGNYNNSTTSFYGDFGRATTSMIVGSTTKVAPLIKPGVTSVR